MATSFHFRVIFFVTANLFLIYTYRSHINEKSDPDTKKAPIPTGTEAFESFKKRRSILQSLFLPAPISIDFLGFCHINAPLCRCVDKSENTSFQSWMITEIESSSIMHFPPVIVASPS